MAGVARKAVNKTDYKIGSEFFISEKEILNFIKSVQFITNIEHDLFTIF